MKLLVLIAFACMIALPAFGQLPNQGFEEWDSQSVGVPKGWSTSGPGVSKIESAHAGEFAASVWNWYISSLGYIVAGETSPPSILDLQYHGTPIDFIPTKLTGFYRYELGENRFNGERQDSAAIYVLVKRFDPESNGIDTISFAIHLLPPSDDWNPFSVDLPLKLSGVEPDSIVVAFYSSNPERPAACGPDGGNCCYFSIDDVALTEISGVAYALGTLLAPARVMPNPVANGTARFEFEGDERTNYTLRVHDALGRLAFQREGVGTEVDLADLDLAAGSYYLTVSDRSKGPIAAGRFIVE